MNRRRRATVAITGTGVVLAERCRFVQPNRLPTRKETRVPEPTDPGSPEYWQHRHVRERLIPLSPDAFLGAQDRDRVSSLVSAAEEKYKVAQGFVEYAAHQYDRGARTLAGLERTTDAFDTATYQLYAARYRAMVGLGLAGSAVLGSGTSAVAGLTTGRPNPGRGADGTATRSGTADRSSRQKPTRGR